MEGMHDIHNWDWGLSFPWHISWFWYIMIDELRGRYTRRIRGFADLWGLYDSLESTLQMHIMICLHKCATALPGKNIPSDVPNGYRKLHHNLLIILLASLAEVSKPPQNPAVSMRAEASAIGSWMRG
jgi:hypothetical protein